MRAALASAGVLVLLGGTLAIGGASFAGLALLTRLAGCDQAHQDDDLPAGPPVRVVATNFDDGRTIPANGSIQIAFDRVLHPATINRQAAIVLETGGRALTNPAVAYDPLTRVLSLSGPDELGTRWLTPGQPYALVLTHPNDPESPGGVRAIDGAPLEQTSRRRLAFFAGPEETTAQARGFDPKVEFCRDVLPIFQTRCSGGACHGAPEVSPPSARFPDGKTRPAMGLVLDTEAGVLNTAILRAAQGANTGSRVGLGSAPARVFGVDMPLIEPGNPSSSWLFYKLLMAPPADGADAASREATLPRCDGSPGPAPVTIGAPLTRFTPLSGEERSRFSNHMIGSAMPYPTSPGEGDRSENLTFEQLERVRVWIAQGAKVTECGACLR